MKFMADWALEFYKGNEVVPSRGQRTKTAHTSGRSEPVRVRPPGHGASMTKVTPGEICLLYTSDAADE